MRAFLSPFRSLPFFSAPLLSPAVVDVVSSPSCNLTLAAPASEMIVRMATRKIEKYCREGKRWAGSEACVTVKRILQLDRVAVKNARKIAKAQAKGQQRRKGAGHAQRSSSGVAGWMQREGRMHNGSRDTHSCSNTC